ncbi:MAG: DNA-binding response regulator [Planctomycetes bacterium]|jgi:two-component system alkaline phosphatase synthesis response regulator PhoP|nr:DNA-binding response regulator [Planctomycetota bacterium]MDP6423639.1 response regulator transcription factor [Planctomycetota bacterium]
MTAPWILVVEDEPLLGDLLVDNLHREGYEVELVTNGKRALERIEKGNIDLVVLDLMLPGLNGLDILRSVRQAQNTVPILVLSALANNEQRIQGLSLGADDYLGKPFQLRELLLRVAALLRRSKPAPASTDAGILRFGGNTIDLATYTATTEAGEEHPLTQKEAALLHYLAGNAGRVVSRSEILDAVWGRGEWPTQRTIDNFIARFRKLFEANPRDPQHFHTLRGVGYKFVE